MKLRACVHSTAPKYDRKSSSNVCEKKGSVTYTTPATSSAVFDPSTLFPPLPSHPLSLSLFPLPLLLSSPRQRTLQELQSAFQSALALLDEETREDMGYELEDLNVIMTKLVCSEATVTKLFLIRVEHACEGSLYDVCRLCRERRTLLTPSLSLPQYHSF